MRTFTDIVKTLRDEKEILRARFCVSEIGVFGSFVRGGQNEKSDIDILVDFTGKVTLFDLIDQRTILMPDLRLRLT